MQVPYFTSLPLLFSPHFIPYYLNMGEPCFLEKGHHSAAPEFFFKVTLYIMPVFLLVQRQKKEDGLQIYHFCTFTAPFSSTFIYLFIYNLKSKFLIFQLRRTGKGKNFLIYLFVDKGRNENACASIHRYHGSPFLNISP